MYENLVLASIYASTIYLCLGLTFSVVFLCWGIQRVDKGAEGTSIGFKLLLIPGLCVFWIIFLNRWIKSKGV